MSELGGLAVLVSNAAYRMTIGGIEELTTEQPMRTCYTNVFAACWLCKAAVGQMQPGSSIIITTSIQAYEPSLELLDHASTKGALVNFTKGLAQELGPRGIRVNTAPPGPIRTPLIPATMPAGKVGSFDSETPPRPRWSTCGARSGLRHPGRPGVQLHHRRADRRHRRDAHALSDPSRADRVDRSPARRTAPRPRCRPRVRLVTSRAWL